MGKGDETFLILNPRQCMKLNGQLHVALTLPLNKEVLIATVDPESFLRLSPPLTAEHNNV